MHVSTLTCKCTHTGENLVVWGTGKPLRQFIYSRDLAELVVWSCLSYKGNQSLMLSTDEKDEISISQLANVIAGKYARFFVVFAGDRIFNAQTQTQTQTQAQFIYIRAGRTDIHKRKYFANALILKY
jgi:nucleoside-diphosphate-sugar epimerase